jgi:antitoxin HicB
MGYRVWIETNEEGTFVAQVPSLPGDISWGSTRQKAIAGYLKSLREHKEAVANPG